MRTFLFAFVFAFLASLALTRAVRDFCRARGWTDKPDARRKIHGTPVPRVGGVAICLSLLLALGAVGLLPTRVADLLRVDIREVIVLLSLGMLMLILGLVDDLRPLSPWIKFTAQTLLGILVWSLGYRIDLGWTLGGETFSLGLLSLPVTVLWVVGITNAFNLIDGIDGLSSGAALFALVSLFLVSLTTQQWTAMLLLSGMAGATLGFLRYNFNPASIFLGDCGSLFLGFMLAVISIDTSQKSSAAVAIAVPIVAFGLPVLDTSMAIIRRFLSGKPIFTGDRRHIHHMLLDRGFSPRKAVILLYGICGIFGLFSLLFLNPSGSGLGLAMAVLGACVWLGIQQLRYPELRELHAHLYRGIHNQRQLIAGSVAVGRMIDGFDSARSLEDLLAGVSESMEDLSFSRVEIRFLGLGQGVNAPASSGWRLVEARPGFSLLRWRNGSPSGWNPSIIVRRGCGSGEAAEFRLEFAIYRNAGPPDGKCIPLAILTFYHRANGEYPVSAVSLLSRNIWMEFDGALERLGFKCLPAVGVDTGVSRDREQQPHDSHSRQSVHILDLGDGISWSWRAGTDRPQ